MKKYLTLVLAVVAALTACDNGADAPQDERARIRIGAVSDAVSDTQGVTDTRSVLPNAPALEDVEWFALYGTASGKAQDDPDYKESWLADLAYHDGVFYYRNDEGRKSPAVVYLRPGNWRFTLYAYQGEDAALKGTATITITASFNGTVNFTLSPYSEAGGVGSVSIRLDLPEGSGVASVETTIDGEPLEQALAVDAGAVVYENDETPAGQYLFSFVLKNSAGKTILVVSDMVVVISGIESAKEYALTAADFNAPPAAPSAFTVASYNAGNQTFHFTWQDNSFNETGFTLSDGTTPHAIAAATQSFDLSVANPTASATYTLKAVNSFGESAPAHISGPIVFTVTFDADNGNTAQTLQANAGGSIGANMPANPTRTDYAFDGWYTAKNGGGSAFTADTMVTRDLTVFAKWVTLYTVTFDADGGSPATQTRAVIDGGTLGANMPPEPTRTDYAFDGWYTAKNGGGSALIADTIITSNLTVYAKWLEGVRYELTKNPDDTTFICNTNDLLPSGFSVGEGEQITVSFSIKTDTALTGFYVGIGDWNNSASYSGGADGWIASGLHNKKSVAADEQFHAYTWKMMASGSAPAGNNPLVFHFAIDGVSKDKVSVYVKNVSVTKSPGLSPDLSLAQSLEWIANNAEENGAYTITLKNSESIAPQTLSYSGKNVSIALNGGSAERILILSSTGSLFTVNNGVTLTLGNNVTLQGRSDNGSSLVSVNTGGALTMESGSKVNGNTAYDGGGIYVNGGVFTLNGGEISGNSASTSASGYSAYSYGGGVYISTGTFTMNGGEISGNSAAVSSSGGAYSYGGGVYVSSGVFTLSGGKISGNSISSSYASSGYTAFSIGGGVYVSSNSTFTLSGGEISGNSTSASASYSGYAYAYGGGVYADGTFTQSGGEISDNSASASGGANSSSGGGVYVSSSGTLTLNGGEISGNSASSSYDSYGGGVGVDSGGTFMMSNGEISGNTASYYGGGVYVNGTFMMSGGEISGNTATYYGGGVRVSSDGTFTLSNGTISGNTAASYGGGVDVYSNGTFTMSNGTISGNSAASYGGGVHVYTNGTFTKQSGGTIYGSDAEDGLKNTADSGGHAVYVSSSKTRDSTAGSGVTLRSAVSGAAGGWETVLPRDSSLVSLLEWLATNAEEGGAYTFTLKNSETVAPQTLSYSGKNVSITLNGETTERIVNLTSTGSLFTIESGVTLTLGSNVTLQGRSGNTKSLVYVNSGGTLVMESGSKMSDNTTSYYGGGVCVNSGGTFTMNGGEISGNTSSYVLGGSYGGGGVVVYGTFTMNGGTISGNSAANTSSYSANRPYGGGGVAVLSGTFTMSGGAISDNITRDGSSAYGGGVYMDGGVFTQSGGEISGNTANAFAPYGIYSYGGGVAVLSGTFTMSGGEISGNTANVAGSTGDSYGGGVYVSYNSTFIKQSGGTIYGSGANTASGDHGSYGHAVYADGKIRNSTAGSGVTLNSGVNGSAGGWE
jgi:uncharacterized repeat protein (TIGR02543 family)